MHPKRAGGVGSDFQTLEISNDWNSRYETS